MTTHSRGRARVGDESDAQVCGAPARRRRAAPRSSLRTAVFCLGALLGCAAAATLANGLGRRRALLATSAACTIGAALEASSCLFPCDAIVPGQCTASAGVLLMLVGRVVAGMASGATTVVTPIYLGELAPPHLRGAFGVMFQLACVAALLCAQVLGLPSLLGTSTLWPLYIFGGVGFPSAVQYVLQGRLLESPQWLVGRSGIDAQEAERVLCILRGVSEEDFGPLRDAVIKELDYMQLSVMQSAASGSGRSPARSCRSLGSLITSNTQPPPLALQCMHGRHSGHSHTTPLMSLKALEELCTSISALVPP